MTYIKSKPYTKLSKLALEFFNKQKPASLVLFELSLMKGEVSFRSFDYLKWKDCMTKSNSATLRFVQSPFGKLIKFSPTEKEQDIALIFVEHHKDEEVTSFFLPSHQTYVLMNSKEAFFYLKKVIE